MTDTLWPDLERHYVAVLTKPPVRASTDVPEDVETLPGAYRVSVAGGDDDRITDSVLVDVEAFHPDRHEAWKLAEDARRAIHANRAAPGILIDNVDTVTRPRRMFYGPHVERYVSTYRVRLRRPRTTN